MLRKLPAEGPHGVLGSLKHDCQSITSMTKRKEVNMRMDLSEAIYDRHGTHPERKLTFYHVAIGRTLPRTLGLQSKAGHRLEAEICNLRVYTDNMHIVILIWICRCVVWLR